MKASSESGLCAMEISRASEVADAFVRTEVLVAMRVLAETSIVNGEALGLGFGGGIWGFVFHSTHELCVRCFGETAYAPVKGGGHDEDGGDRDQKRYVESLHMNRADEASAPTVRIAAVSSWR